MGATCRWTLVRRFLTAAVSLVLLGALAACEPPQDVVFFGHGFGHGNGMGQYGAYGYAVDDGWSTAQILDHYYGGTRTATLTTNRDQRVFLTASQGRDLVVYQPRAQMSIVGFGSERFTSVRIARVDADRFQVWTATAAACTFSGAWQDRGHRSAAELVVVPTAPAVDADDLLQHCGSTGTRYYRGSLLAVQARGSIVTVNLVDTESLIRGVVPREVPPSWADAGGGRGAATVRAQAVAARSYALAGDTRWTPYATTCDSATCQAYSGHGFRANGSSVVQRNEDPRTDRAVADTARQVRLRPNDTVARTEFATSSGGWTAGGAFPAVPDDGDDTAINPYHDWSFTIARTALEAKFDQRQGVDVGTYEGTDILSRNGLGAEGGRVLSVRVRFTAVDVTLTGDQLRLLLALRSNWFSVQ
jgi:peptidoglycan hydrolase-like amidase